MNSNNTPGTRQAVREWFDAPPPAMPLVASFVCGGLLLLSFSLGAPQRDFSIGAGVAGILGLYLVWTQYAKRKARYVNRVSLNQLSELFLQDIQMVLSQSATHCGLGPESLHGPSVVLASPLFDQQNLPSPRRVPATDRNSAQYVYRHWSLHAFHFAHGSISVQQLQYDWYSNTVASGTGANIALTQITDWSDVQIHGAAALSINLTNGRSQSFPAGSGPLSAFNEGILSHLRAEVRNAIARAMGAWTSRPNLTLGVFATAPFAPTLPAATVTCTRCGANMPGTQRFCGQCGTPFGQQGAALAYPGSR